MSPFRRNVCSEVFIFLVQKLLGKSKHFICLLQINKILKYHTELELLQIDSFLMLE